MSDKLSSTGVESPPKQSDPMMGKIIGEYRIERRIGNGGMGVVYLAVHSEIAKRVAIKVLAPNLTAHRSYRERFFREAKACSKVQSPSLVQIFGYGELEDGTLYILMEYLEGQSLAERLKKSSERRPTLLSALHIAQQIAAALETAHEAGIVHRDIKPDNIMLVADSVAPQGERAKILDFGIAKFVGPEAMPTIDSQGIIGTPTYMAPERCRGDEIIDGQSDVYALGCVLYEMLCGRPPFIGEARDLMMCHIGTDPMPLRERLTMIPFAIDKLVTRMLAKSPSARPSMAEVSHTLRRLLTNPAVLMDAVAQAPLTSDRKRLQSGVEHGIRLAKRWLMPVLSFVIVLGILFVLFSHVLTSDTMRPDMMRPDMMRVKGGSFAMGSDAESVHSSRDLVQRLGVEKYKRIYLPTNGATDPFSSEQPRHKVVLSPFEIDITEVTNVDYVEYLSKLDKQRIEIKPSTDDDSYVIYLDNILLFDNYAGRDDNGIAVEVSEKQFTTRVGKDNLPVTAVTWDAAHLYCLAHGKRLPTEAEWEYLASNGGQTRFPWGDELPSCTYAVFERGKTFGVCLPKQGPMAPGLLPVRSMSKDKNDLGVYDLGGSVAEWVEDSFVAPYAPCQGECRDPVVESPATTEKCKAGLRVVRGGGWSLDMIASRATSRIDSCRDKVSADTGFRCARTPK